MPRLVYIGPNEKNKGGFSSKAYTVHRRGRRVIVRYGRVRALGSGGSRLEWVGQGPQPWEKGFPTEREAQSFVRCKVTEKESKGYERLPRRVRIR